MDESHPNYLFAESHFGSQASVPLLHGGRVVGVLNLEGKVGELAEDDLRLLETPAAPAAAAIENATLLARLEELAHRDPLTRLLNRRGIIGALEAALSSLQRRAGDRSPRPVLAGDAQDAPVTILLVDLNGFKAVNDRYGHAAGDVLLAGLASLLAWCVRSGDTVGRLGGDEFLIVMPGADEFAALGLIKRLADAFASYPFPISHSDGDAPPPSVGYSLGLASAPEDGDDAETLLRVADDAMYRAKRGAAGPIRFFARDQADIGPLAHRP
jgi:diguanylate cyclase (GGDEF)-like protein